MGRKIMGGVLITAFVLLAGCKAPLLRELDADIPSALVKQYAESDKAYVDQGHLWAPFITALGMRVSKTEEGYHSTGNFDIGPFGALILGRQSSDYDEQGRLLRHTVRATSLWGFLLSDSSCREHDGTKGKWDEQWSRRILFGLLGYEGDSRGFRAGYFLFIPIVTSHGDKCHPGHEREMQREREAEQGGRDQGRPHGQEELMTAPLGHL